MTKLYYVRTNAYDMIISDNGEIRRVMTDSNECNIYAENNEEKFENALRILESVEDDSLWEIYCEETVEELIHGDCEVLAEIEW